MTLVSNCPICSADKITKIYSGNAVRPEWRGEGNFDVWGCASCDHRFVNPPTEPDVLSRCYSSQYNPYEEGHGTGKIDKAIEQAKREKRYRHVDLTPNMDVLDVGCGSGSFLCVIRDLVQSIHGVEPSEHGVKTCEKLGVPVFHGDFETFHQESDQKFDLITLNHVLEHHPDPTALFKILREHLKEGGRVWIAVPNAGCAYAKTLQSDWHSSDLPVHLQQFTASSLTSAAEYAGMRVEMCRTESENSLPYSASTWLRRFGIPQRLSQPFLKGAYSKTGFMGQRIDASGNGEALILSAVA